MNINKGIKLWNRAKKIIPGGSQLLSKRSEIFLPEQWPSYFKKAKGIGVNFHYPVIYSHPFYQQSGYKNFRLANAEKYQDSCITLPLHTKLTKKDIKYICNKIKKYFKYGIN